MDFRSVVALLEQKGKVVHVKSEVNLTSFISSSVSQNSS